MWGTAVRLRRGEVPKTGSSRGSCGESAILGGCGGRLAHAHCYKARISLRECLTLHKPAAALCGEEKWLFLGDVFVVAAAVHAMMGRERVSGTALPVEVKVLINIYDIYSIDI